MKTLSAIEMSRRKVWISKLIFTAILLSCFAAPLCEAQDTPALDISGLGSGQDYYQNNSYCTGWRFTANKDLNVTALGFYDDLKNGIAGNHDAGIYDVVSKQLLVTATIVPSDPLTGFFRYHTLATPVTLPGGRDYYVQVVTLADRYALQPNVTVDPAITFQGIAGDDGFTPSSTLHYPVGITAPGTYVGDFGPSFLISNPGAPGNPAAAVDFSTLGTGTDVNQGSFCMGFHFTPTQDIVLSTLGYYDDKKNGFTQSHSVSIFDLVAHSLVVSTVVTTSDPLRGFFRYHSIPAVTLKAGFDYAIMGDNSSDNYARDVNTTTSNPLVTVKGGAFTNTAPTTGAEYPTQIDMMAPFFGPNFEILKATAPPLVVSFTTPQSVALLGRTLNFTLLATAGKPNASVTYNVTFGDAGVASTGTLTIGTPTVLMHAYNVPGPYTVQAVVTDGVSIITPSLSLSLPAPSSGGMGVENSSQKVNDSYTTKDGFTISVKDSDGGVIEMEIDDPTSSSSSSVVQKKTIPLYSNVTAFNDANGQGATVSGNTPIHVYGQHGIFDADVTVTDATTSAVVDHGRKMIVISAAETGEPIAQDPLTKGSPATVLGTAPNPVMMLKTLKGKFYFNGSKSDLVQYTGSIQLPIGLNISQKHELFVGIGNVIVNSSVDAHGKGLALKGTALKSLKITYSRVKKGTLTKGGELADVTFSLSATNLITAGFDTEGISKALAPVAPLKVTPLKIQVGLLLDGVPYESAVPVNFSILKDGNTATIKNLVRKGN